MSNYRVISSDSHVVEPPDLWSERMDPKFGDRIPRLMKEEPGDMWYVDNAALADVGNFCQAGLRFDQPEKVTSQGVFDEVPLGGYDPHAHVKDMDLDGVHGGLVYPSLGLYLYSKPDTDLLRAIFSAYNDWLADFCKPCPDRLKGAAMILLDGDVEAGVAEMRRAAKIGLAGAMISVFPTPGPYYNNPTAYEAVWATAQELDMPLSLHVGTNRPGSMEIEEGKPGQLTVVEMTNGDFWPRQSMCQMIYGGVFDRYPDLKVVNVEHELAWIPYFINRMDSLYHDYPLRTPYRFKGDARPSDFMYVNVFHSFQEDALGVRDRHLIGLDNLMWGSDYPHSESTFPESRRVLDEILADVPEDEKAKIVGGNASRLYKFS